MQSQSQKRQSNTKVALAGILTALMVFAPVAHAAEIYGTTFRDFYRINGVDMTLQGAGLKRVLFLKAFAAGFYAGDIKGKANLGEFPKRIEVEYYVHIPAKKLSKFTIDQMHLNVSLEEFNKIQHEVQLMTQYFVDLKPGDRFSLTYIPGIGTQFAHNGQEVGVIPGNAFARALFAVWIGEKPFDPQLKNQIYHHNNS